MSELFLQKDVAKLLHNKFVVIMGSSVQRSMYKDLVKMLKKDMYLTDHELRAKGESKFEDDRLIEGGILSNNVSYREVREYKTDYHLIRFYFITRTYNNYVESVLKTFRSEPEPDVLLLNSCLWDITRYGLGPESVEGYRQNLHKLMKKLKTVLDPNCLVLWNSTLPVDKEAKGGVFVPEVESAKTQLGAKILACNLIAHNIIKQYDYDYIDLHYYLRYHLHRRAEDGVHWDMTAHRRMSNLTLFQIAEAWGLKKSEPIPSPTETPHGEKADEGATTSSIASDSVVYVACSPVVSTSLVKAFSPSTLTKALHTVAKTSSTKSTKVTNDRPVVAANTSRTAAKSAAITSTTTSVAQPITKPSSAKSSIGPIKTKKKNRRKKQNKVLNNQENANVSSGKNNGPHPYNRPPGLKPQTNINQTGPQKPPLNGPANQERFLFNGPANQQRPSFNDPANQQYHQGPSFHREQLFHEAHQNEHHHHEEHHDEHYNQGNAHNYGEQGHYDHYNIQHIERDLNQMNNALYNDYNVYFGNYDFTKDVDVNEGNYQSNVQYQHQGYERHEYLQTDGGFNSYTNHGIASHRFKPYSRYQANRELYGGSRYQH